jgi:hypothetical protein
MPILVRPRAWWYNKVPLSVLLWLMLVDGKPLAMPALLGLVALVGCVCGIGNYGYALNELFDRDEDIRAGRTNAAHAVANSRMWAVILLSASVATILAELCGGASAVALTCLELLLPLAYSIPPLRVKERGWLGVSADALAAHVYPAALAMLIAAHLSLRIFAWPMIGAVLAWSAATGLRGILSHQLQTEASDRHAGLVTVVHRIGHPKLVAFVLRVLLPIEVIGFSAAFLQSDATALIRIVAVLYLIYEFMKLRFNVFPVIVFDRKYTRYIPFVDEGFYKVVGPLGFALDAAVFDPRYLIIAALHFLLFNPRVTEEWRQWRLASGAFAHQIGVSAAKLRNWSAARSARARDPR